MIYQKEIIEKANEWEVTPNTVDKDYVLGHFLNCFFNFQNNKKLFVFKGGTCLRKCYFSDYRFSEDLDFTILNKSFLPDEEWISQITKQCTKNTGIRFHLSDFEKKLFKDVLKGYHYKIAFWGANHNRNTAPPPVERWHTKIELDFSFDEKIFFPVRHLTIKHLYSDKNIFDNQIIPAYSTEEILIEKIRAFFQRSYKAPRDFYDVWYLLNKYKFTDLELINKALLEKCELKGVIVNDKMFYNDKIYNSVKSSWKRSIAHHLPAKKLPNFDEVWSFLKENLFLNFFKIK